MCSMKRKNKKNFIQKLFIACFTGTLVFSAFGSYERATASSLSSLAGRLNGDGGTAVQKPARSMVSLSACMDLAINFDSKYEEATMEVESLEEQRTSALKAIELRKKDLSTFRWSPLLSFHFPEDPSFSESYEFAYKPIKLANDIFLAKRKVTDRIVALNKEITDLYVEIYSLQQKLSFQNDSLSALNTGIARNKARVLTGQGKQADVDKLEKRKETLTESIASNERTKLNDLMKLSDKIGMDITTDFEFEEPFVQSEMTRDDLEKVVQFTLDLDTTYYEACLNESSQRASLLTNWDLVKGHYKASDYKIIASYVNAALSGQAVPKKAFKADHKAFLDAVDRYWKGKKRIFWFIKIPRLWLKGEEDGVRYIQDDPNVMYQGVLDYREAVVEKEAAAKEVETAVRDRYESFITTKNAYNAAKKLVDEEKVELDKAAILNATGQVSEADDAAMTFDEYQDKQKQYEEDQNALLDALKTYTDTMNEFNRTACGGVYPYLTGKSVRLSASGTGLSYSEDSDKAMYYFNPIIQSQEFEVSVFIPENFPIELSTYELWVDTTKIGETTDIDKSIRHLSLVTGNYQKVLLRFFDGNGNFVDDCEINPSVAKGPLDIVTERKAGEDEVKIGTFTAETNDDTEITTITLTLDDGRDEKKYRILTEDGAFVSSDEKLEISKPFKYLSLITKDFRRLKIEFFDENDNLLSEGRFDDSALEKKIMKVNKQ